MFARSVRVSPWRLRWTPSSLGRSTRTTPSSWTMRISGCRRWVSVPRGPFTVTSESSPTDTSTPLGISMGCFPMRLMGSPHVRQDLAADALAGGVAVGHDTLRGGQDGDPQPAEHARERPTARVDAASGLAHPLQAGDRALALRAVAERDAERALDALALGGVALDEALGREDPQQGVVHPRGRDQQVVLVGQVRVADPGEHVADRIRDVGRESHHDAFVTPGSSPAWASSRKQMRHNRNLRYTARERPHRRHRVYSRTLYFPLRSCFSISAFFAMSVPLRRPPPRPGSPRRGSPARRAAPCP